MTCRGAHIWRTLGRRQSTRLDTGIGPQHRGDLAPGSHISLTTGGFQLPVTPSDLNSRCQTRKVTVVTCHTWRHPWVPLRHMMGSGLSVHPAREERDGELARYPGWHRATRLAECPCLADHTAAVDFPVPASCRYLTMLLAWHAKEGCRHQTCRRECLSWHHADLRASCHLSGCG